MTDGIMTIDEQPYEMIDSGFEGSGGMETIDLGVEMDGGSMTLE